MNEVPIADFINEYGRLETARLHMPGHKGSFGYEDDITEIKGADSLYEADGIIRKSEIKTSQIFGAKYTFYGTEGSSQIIKAMCHLAIRHSWSSNNNPVIAATRNAHKSFIHASMLLRFKISWIKSEGEYSLCKCILTPDGLRSFLDSFKSQNEGNVPVAVYITSPDYLGNMLDIRGLAEVAHKFETLLLVDNAHGSYLNFVEPNLHPMTLGADMCADSAHKTLPVLTGGAYLHISKRVPENIVEDARQCLLIFGSTSPSYMILKSLDLMSDRVNVLDYRKCTTSISGIKKKLIESGIKLEGNEPLKITMDFRYSDYTGTEVAEILRSDGIECEFADNEFIVTMWSPFMDYEAVGERLVSILSGIDIVPRDYISEKMISVPWKEINVPEKVFETYETLFLPHHTEKVENHIIGKTVADIMVGCPPAVSPIVAGECISEEIYKVLKYYGIEEIEVLDE